MREIVQGLLLSAGVLGLIDGAIAQVPSAQEEALVRSVSEQLKAREEITFSRVTSEGELSSCEIEFETSYRDRRANQGRPVVVMGSIASMYSEGKYPSVMLKIKMHVMDLRGNTPWRPVQPSFADAVIGNTALKPYRVGFFVCEGGGLCQVFSDAKMAPYIAILDASQLDIELRLSLVKGGMDQPIKLSSVGDTKVARTALDGYQTCTLEVLGHTVKEIKRKM